MNAGVHLDDIWYGNHPLSRLLAPVGWLFCALAAIRRLAYRRGLLKCIDVGVPVVVVGNLTVGGSGKTPLVVWLASLLREHGFRPGVVSRGYGGRARQWPQWVTPESDPAEVGDEPLLIARRSGVPVCAAPDRPAAARCLVAAGCDILISDDGLQHYRLARKVEIVVVDGRRRFGNGRCLPAGPLREPVSRLAEADLVVVNGGEAPDAPHRLRLLPDHLQPVDGTEGRESLSAWRGRKVHAVAGIGDPQRFFDTLRAAGLEVEPHPYPDHHCFTGEELSFPDGAPVLMTEKDAVKCRQVADSGCWYLPVSAQLSAAFGPAVIRLLKR